MGTKSRDTHRRNRSKIFTRKLYAEQILCQPHDFSIEAQINLLCDFTHERIHPHNALIIALIYS